MDRRFQVFISSTFLDLQEERREAMMALLETDAIPAGMELFQAADANQWEYIRQVIKQCDYYLLILGGRYGSMHESGLSYTEMEFDFAVAQKKPVMAFIKSDIENLPAKYVEDTPEGRKKLDVFRAKVMKDRMCRHFRAASDLGGLVTRGYIHAKKHSPADGWVPGSLALTPEVQQEMAMLRDRVRELEVELSKARVAAPAGSEELSQGDDTYTFSLQFQDGESGHFRTKTYDYDYDLTWNQIFGAAGALLWDECPESSLRGGLSWAIFPFLPLEVRELAVRKSVSISVDDFQNVKIQLLALGLMGRSDRKHGVNDRGTYWSLTPYGRTTLTRLRAIRKDGRHFYSPPEGGGVDPLAD